MERNKENETLIAFWDDWFKKLTPEKIDKTQVKAENDLDLYLKELGDVSERVLDLGTGAGYGLLTTKLLGQKVAYALGIDPSANAINYLKELCHQSEIDGIDLRQGDHQILKDFEDESFDGIVCSNTLDVVPLETSNAMIEEITRLLKPGGLFVMKLNFYLTEALIERIKMEEVAPNTYALNGVIRGLNFTTDEWIAKFEGFDLVKQSEFERVKNGPKDRVLMLKKR